LGGVLRWLDPTDASIPIEQLRTYLIAKYQSRFSVTPRRLEEIVAGVFADFGFTVRVTSFSGDDGIDVLVLDSTSGETIGVQVKRYKGRVEAEQIRAFAGALVLGGMTHGVFVATSGFTRGARSTAQRYCERGVSVELTDGLRFFEELRITQRPQYLAADDPTAPFFEPLRNPDRLPIVVQVSW
jgi:restriction system protein